MILGRNIEYLRKKNSMGQEELAEKLNYKSYTTIQKWESGVSAPPIKTLKALSELFNISMEDLANKDLQKPLPPDDNRTLAVRIPVVGDVAAGGPIEAIEDVIDFEEIPSDMAKKGEFFGLKIKGNSMEPLIRENDVVIVRQQSDAETGDIVIVRIDGNSAACKRLRKYADGALELISLNPSYEPMYFDREQVESEPVEIVGVVVENRQKFKSV